MTTPSNLFYIVLDTEEYDDKDFQKYLKQQHIKSLWIGGSQNEALYVGTHLALENLINDAFADIDLVDYIFPLQ